MNLVGILWKSVLVVTLFLMTGCASTPEEKRRFFWPPLPDEPKIEWLGAYRNKLDMPRTSFEKFMDSVVGQPQVTSLTRPLSIVTDGVDRVYVSDVVLVNVMVFDFKKRDVTYLGAGKSDEPVMFRHPSGLAIDREKNLYVCDTVEKRVYVFSPEEKLTRTIDLSRETKQPIGLAIDPERNRLLVGDVRLQQIMVYGLDGKYQTVIGHSGGGNIDGAFLFPGMLAVMRDGNIVVADSMNSRVQIFDPDGKFIRKFGSRGDGPGEFQIIKGIAADSENHIYVADAKANSVAIFSNKGEYLLTLGGAYSAERIVAPGGFLLPQGVFVDEKDTIYVVDQMNGRFQMFQYLNERYLKEHPVEAKPPTPPAPAR